MAPFRFLLAASLTLVISLGLPRQPGPRPIEAAVSTPPAPPIAPRFQAYYAAMDGPRLLGGAISNEITRPPFPRQYFEKGVLEDHAAEGLTASEWQFMYGLLVDELQQARALLPVGGDASTLTYAEIHDFADPSKRSEPPLGSGPTVGPQGLVFVPYTPDLSRAPGQYVPNYFWTYLNRADLFPAGWLHDVGLPLTPALDATVDKGPFRGRRIKVQAFQRTVLTYDPQNPPEWQIERANVGTDYLRAFPIAGR